MQAAGWRETGSDDPGAVSRSVPARGGGNGRWRRLPRDGQDLLGQRVPRGGPTLHAMPVRAFRAWLEAKRGICVGYGGVWRFLAREGPPFKRRLHAAEPHRPDVAIRRALTRLAWSSWMGPGPRPAFRPTRHPGRRRPPALPAALRLRTGPDRDDVRQAQDPVAKGRQAFHRRRLESDRHLARRVLTRWVGRPSGTGRTRCNVRRSGFTAAPGAGVPPPGARAPPARHRPAAPARCGGHCRRGRRGPRPARPGSAAAARAARSRARGR